MILSMPSNTGTTTSTPTENASVLMALNAAIDLHPSSGKQRLKVCKTYSSSCPITSSKSYSPPVRNRLVEQEKKEMNKTFTIGTRLLGPPTCQPPRRGRSSSIDSDFGDYTIHGAISGLFPRSLGSGIKFSGNHLSRKAYSHFNQSAQHQRKFPKTLNSATAANIWKTCAKLPSLEGCTPDRKCCVKPFVSSRAQYELAKYKDTLKNN